MAGVPRTQCLLRRIGTTAAGQIGFTVPAGTVLLVKSFYVQNASAAAVTNQLSVQTAGGGGVLYLYGASIAASTFATWQGWIALNPGDAVVWVYGAAGQSGWLSGAILQGPPPFPPAVTALPA